MTRMPDESKTASRTRRRLEAPRSESLNESLQPLRQEPLGTQVLRELRRYVRARGLSVGDRLPTERDLAEALGVNRGTVREALISLESVGVVERKPRRGTTLGKIDLSLLGEILRFVTVRTQSDELREVRRLLEANMLPLVVANATADDWARMTEINDRMAANVETWPRVVEADMAFHEALLAATGNDMLRQFHGLIHEAFEANAYFPAEMPTILRAIDEHRRLIELLRAGDVGAAQTLMESHLKDPNEANRAAGEQPRGDVPRDIEGEVGVSVPPPEPVSHFSSLLDSIFRCDDA